MIIGSNSQDKIQGKLQRARNVSFIPKDKGKLKNLFKLILLSVYLTT